MMVYEKKPSLVASQSSESSPKTACHVQLFLCVQKYESGGVILSSCRAKE